MFCLERYLFYTVDKGDHTLDSIRLMYSFRCAMGGIFTCYVVYIFLGMLLRQTKEHVDRLTILITAFYLLDISSKFVRDANAFSLINEPKTNQLFLSMYLGRVARVAQLSCFLILQCQW